MEISRSQGNQCAGDRKPCILITNNAGKRHESRRFAFHLAFFHCFRLEQKVESRDRQIDAYDLCQWLVALEDNLKCIATIRDVRKPEGADQRQTRIGESARGQRHNCFRERKVGSCITHHTAYNTFRQFNFFCCHLRLVISAIQLPVNHRVQLQKQKRRHKRNFSKLDCIILILVYEIHQINRYGQQCGMQFHGGNHLVFINVKHVKYSREHFFVRSQIAGFRNSGHYFFPGEHFIIILIQIEDATPGNNCHNFLGAAFFSIPLAVRLCQKIEVFAVNDIIVIMIQDIKDLAGHILSHFFVLDQTVLVRVDHFQRVQYLNIDVDIVAADTVFIPRHIVTDGTLRQFRRNYGYFFARDFIVPVKVKNHKYQLSQDRIYLLRRQLAGLFSGCRERRHQKGEEQHDTEKSCGNG